jgi:hypothetical protein
VNDRGKPDEDSIPIPKAWHRVAKMLFPEEPVRWLTERDCWLIKHYYLPQHLDPIFGSNPVIGDNRVPAPKEVFAEVDRAYFRQSLQNEVDEWFVRRSFDPYGSTIPKHRFEAAFQAEFGQLPFEPVKPVEKGTAKAKPRKPTTPAKEPKKTQRTRLISLMEEIGLAKSGLLLHEVREKVRPQFQKKHRGLKLPADSTIDRAYRKYASATDTRVE